jgi:segregation and condensation protein A
VRQRMSDVLRKLGDGAFHRFETFFDTAEGRTGVVVTFLSLLELAKDRLIEIMQDAPLAPIYLKARAVSEISD